MIWPVFGFLAVPCGIFVLQPEAGLNPCPYSGSAWCGGGISAFQCISLICRACFSDVMVFAGFRKQSWIRLAADPQTVTETFFWCKFGFGKCFAASRSSHWAGRHWSLYIIHFLLPVTIWSRNGSSLLHRIREDDTSKGRFFDFQSAFEALIYQAFLPVQFASNAEWLTLSSLATSRVVIRGLALMIALSWSLSTSSGRHSAPHLQSSLLLCKLLESPLHCVFSSSSWAKHVVDVASCLCYFPKHFEFE